MVTRHSSKPCASEHFEPWLLPIDSKADIEVCTYIISGHTFERRAVRVDKQLKSKYHPEPF